MDYGFTHQNKVYTPNQTPGVTPADVEERNKAIERDELERWKGQPDRHVVYFEFPIEITRQDSTKPYRTRFQPVVTDAYVSTWLGTRLGTITRAHVYTTNLGGRIVCLQVTGTNGSKYYGRASYDNGNCVWLRKAKR